ncbi:hypothetical protein ABIA35_001152 [Catenulispora sp. MAP12-49]
MAGAALAVPGPARTEDELSVITAKGSVGRMAWVWWWDVRQVTGL